MSFVMRRFGSVLWPAASPTTLAPRLLMKFRRCIGVILFCATFSPDSPQPAWIQVSTTSREPAGRGWAGSLNGDRKSKLRTHRLPRGGTDPYPSLPHCLKNSSTAGFSLLASHDVEM